MGYFRRGVTLASLFFVSGCGPARAPSFLLLGSYFPSWLIGAGLSIPVTLLIRWGLVRAGVDDVLPARLFVYVCVAVIFTMAFAYYFSPR